MSPELIMLNKHLKRMYPFIVKVDQYTCSKHNAVNIIIYLSPIHFCETMDDQVELKLQKIMVEQTSNLIRTILSDWSLSVRFLFYPDVNNLTIFDDISVMPINTL